jgi:hypothetical protein
MNIGGRGSLAAKACVAILGGVAFAHSVLAQEPPPPTNLPANPLPSPTQVPTPTTVSRGGLSDLVFHKSPYEVWLTLLIITFGLIVLGLYIYAIRNIPHRRPDDISRAVIVVSVITGSLLLITAGYTNEQVAPAFGLFGTIIGYMLGRMNQPPGQPTETPPDHAAPKEGEK